VSGRRLTKAGQIFTRLPTPLFFSSKAGYISMTRAIRAYFLSDRVVYKIRDLAVEVQFLGATRNVDPQGEDQQATMVNYLVGDRPQDWSTDRLSLSETPCSAEFFRIREGEGRKSPRVCQQRKDTGFTVRPSVAIICLKREETPVTAHIFRRDNHCPHSF
jgi:hypothetical protein